MVPVVASKAHQVDLAALLNILLNGLEIVITYSFAFLVAAVVAQQSAMGNVAVRLIYSIDLVERLEQLLIVLKQKADVARRLSVIMDMIPAVILVP